VIVGNGGDDVLMGGEGPNDLSGGDGDDLLRAGAGDGDVHGGAGSDRYAAAACCGPLTIDLRAGILSRDGQTFSFVAIESVTGSPHGDTLLGSPGPDVLVGWRGDDTIRGRGGDDHLRDGEGEDSAHGGGIDRCVSVEVPTSCEDLRGERRHAERPASHERLTTAP